MDKTPIENYQKLMEIVRNRFDVIKELRKIKSDNYRKSEMVAFHGRKIIDAIAIGCLIATDHGLKHIPKNTKGKYTPKSIFIELKKSKIDILQSPSIIRQATPEEKEENNVKYVLDGISKRRISVDELIKKYERISNRLHELNPYIKDDHEIFYKKNHKQLQKDLEELELFLISHLIIINGEAFFCTLRDEQDGKTKVIGLSKANQ